MKRRTLILITLATIPLLAEAKTPSINQGVKLLKQGKAEEAAEILTQAQELNPALAQYNLGNALYRQNQYPEAAKAYEDSMRTTDLIVQQHAAYNAGNALLAELTETGAELDTKKKLELAKKATGMYRHAIELAPSDRDAKQNFERAKKLSDQLEEQQKQEEQQKDQDKQDQDKQDQDKQDQEQQDQNNQDQDQQDQQDQEQQDQEQQDQEQQDQEQQNQDDQQQQGDDQEQQDQAPQPEPQPQQAEQMTEQEAQQLLDSMKQDEQDKRPQFMYGRPQRVEKDW